MTHYRSNLADIRFNFFEVFGRDRLLGTGPWADLDVETAVDMLGAGAELATTELAKSFADTELGDITFDPATGTVSLPDTFKKSYAKYVDAEWWRMDVDPAVGGISVPPSLRWAMAEFTMGSNPAILFYAQGWPLAQVLYEQGNEAQKRIAAWMIERHWGATMVLTEPDAGSAVGSAKTKAIPQPDGSWHIEGVKRFITNGDYDMVENIVHFVLARPVDTAGAGGPGTKGLSLFIVPKFHIDPETGDLGKRNGAVVTNVEHKMGLKASATCELTFGQKDPAVGWLVGDVHRGISQMFEIVEYARMLVGTKAMATLSTGYLNALEYAKTRVQGQDLVSKGDPCAPSVPIIRHPDVRRSLMLQKAYAEGMRALLGFAASVLDDIELARHEGKDLTAALARKDLLLPIVKGFCSEQGYAKLSETLQVFGGSGYLCDYPAEQYLRDSKIDTIYEGTTAIQGIDLFFRKILRDNRSALNALLDEIDAEVAEVGKASELVLVSQRLAQGLVDVRSAVDALMEYSAKAKQDPQMVYLIGLQTTRLVMMLGELLVGWLLSRQALIATSRLAGSPLEDSARSFYEGKVTAARFFAVERLPMLGIERQALEYPANEDIMALQDESF
ncbi:acyl-CoA dehydrogenase domain-containing protein [Mycolicibacterium rhodesiae JS60]|nr:acyl-CoA dehydrogenase domain-containing protein [Mycolicibacterium rhodesiae JS60]